MELIDGGYRRSVAVSNVHGHREWSVWGVRLGLYWTGLTVLNIVFHF